MRSLLVLLALLTFTLAGCTEDPTPAADEDPTEATPGPIPDAIHHEGSMPAYNVPPGVLIVCQSVCERAYPFDIPGNDSLQVELVLRSVQGRVSDPTGTSGIETDYDLEVRDAAGKLIGESFEFGDTPDIIKGTWPPGTYTARVRTFQDYDGSYTLDITFSR